MQPALLTTSNIILHHHHHHNNSITLITLLVRLDFMLENHHQWINPIIARIFIEWFELLSATLSLMDFRWKYCLWRICGTKILIEYLLFVVAYSLTNGFWNLWNSILAKTSYFVVSFFFLMCLFDCTKVTISTRI